jgi:hypothetical protein
MNRVDGASQIGFMPFNKLNTSAGRDENGYYALSGLLVVRRGLTLSSTLIHLCQN